VTSRKSADLSCCVVCRALRSPGIWREESFYVRLCFLSLWPPGWCLQCALSITPPIFHQPPGITLADRSGAETIHSRSPFSSKDALVVDCEFEQTLAVESLNHAESFARVSARISVPRAISSSDAYSSGRWLYPLRQGINNIPVGAIREMKSESW
jgi:hypothetical protein